MDALVWDAGNQAHLDERNAARRAAGQREITRDEMNALYDLADYTTQDVEYLNRAGWEIQVRLIGRTSEGRFLTVACQVARDGRFRPVTVWASAAVEIDLYWKDTDDNEQA